MAKRFDELRVYQEARALYVLVFRIAQGPGFRGRRELAKQMADAASSCAANIAEGFCRRTKADMANFFSIVTASATEVQAHLDLAHATGACSRSDFEQAYAHAEAVKALSKAFIQGIWRSGPWRCETES